MAAITGVWDQVKQKEKKNQNKTKQSPPPTKKNKTKTNKPKNKTKQKKNKQKKQTRGYFQNVYILFTWGIGAVYFFDITILGVFPWFSG